MAKATEYWNFTRNQSDLDVITSVLKYVKSHNGEDAAVIHSNILDFITKDSGISFGDNASPSHKTALPDRIRLLYQLDKKLYISSYGELFLKYIKNNSALSLILSEALFKAQFPCDRCTIIDDYNIFYFRLIFKLLLEDKLGNKLSKQDIVNELYYITGITHDGSNYIFNDKLLGHYDYDTLISNILDFRSSNPYVSNNSSQEVSVNYVINIMDQINLISYDSDKIFFTLNSNIAQYINKLFEIYPLEEDAKGKDFWDYNFYNSVSPYLLDQLLNIDTDDTPDNTVDDFTPPKPGINKIIYGAPGTGKSYSVDDEYAKGNNFIRVTFHPEYSNSDFIGYVKPSMNNTNVEYKFEPGPFTKIIKKAFNKKDEMFTLIIEELNRANAPGVFGDIFQLLDRDDSTGKSKYKVHNSDVAKYVFGDENTQISLPPNLDIIATMNTSDQNVFTMDTAFKRRWKFEYLPIEFKQDHKFAHKNIPNTTISWKKFVKTFNKFIMSTQSNGFFTSEDKQIGPYFISESELLDLDLFAYKVLLYIWDDVVKVNKQIIFNSSIDTFSDLVEAFKSDPLSVFNDRFKDLLLA